MLKNNLDSNRAWISKITVVVAALLIVSGIEVAAQGQMLPVAGGSQYLWFVKPDKTKKSVTIYQRSISAPASELSEVGALSGLLAPGGIASGKNELDIVYQNLNVQKIYISINKKENKTTPQYRFETAAPLPKGAKLKAFANVNGELWAVVAPRSVDGKKKSGNDAQAQSQQQKDRLKEAELSRALGLPPAVIPDKQEKEHKENDITKSKQTNLNSKDRLLRLLHGRWQEVNLPADWDANCKVWLVNFSKTYPILLRQTSPKNNSSLKIYRRTKQSDNWKSKTVSLLEKGAVKPLVVDRQLVLAQYILPDKKDDSLSGVQVNLFVFRGNKLFKIGKLALDKLPEDSLWSVAGDGLSVALLGKDKASKDAHYLGAFTAMNLQGRVTQKPLEMEGAAPKDTGPGSDQFMIWFIVMVMAIFMVYVFWKRDLRKQEAKLPNGIVLGGFGKRAIAGFIDLAPIVLVVSYFYGVGPFVLFTHHWPGQEGVRGWQAMSGGLWVIAIFVLYTAFAEMIFQKTIGKWMAGLWVVDLEGKRPAWWRLLLRCLLKALDLVAWILLLFPGLNPLRQRLGDMVAGTVVVMKKPKGKVN